MRSIIKQMSTFAPSMGEGKTGKESSNGSFVCFNKEADSIKVGKSNTVIEKHVKGRAVAFAPSGTMLETWMEAEHKDGKS